MASSANAAEGLTQCKSSACRCGEGDSSLWTSRLADNSEKQASKCPNCQVYKSGYLLLSSKGIGWTSWKKRWFILTRTSLIFFRSDPDSQPQKGNEGNLTLGGIDLNNSASIVVKADKKLLTVLFPDGREGRAFTLKAETSEDLLEWKTALESALAQAPSPALAMGPNGIFRNDTAEPDPEPIEPSLEQAEKDKQPLQSTVIGQPVQVALEDSDGNPSFLEKALVFIEQHGIKVEGILRQSADVEEVERRVREYEQGKVEFSADEDAHVIGDCIKHVLRELPSSPVPAPCCTALVEAYRTDRGNRINAMRDVIYETFPEHNLRLLQRILKMMLTVASHKTQNRMSLSALAACMAPLLLRPLLAGDCEFDDNFSMGGDGSIQLLKAAAAANHAQAIVIILLEEYDKVFDEDLLSSEIYSESEDGDFEDYESTDNDFHDHDGYDDGNQDIEADIDDDPGHSSSGTVSENGSFVESDQYDKKKNQNKASSASKEQVVLQAAVTVTETKVDNVCQEDGDHKLMSPTAQVLEKASSQKMEELQFESSNTLASPSSGSNESVGEFPTAASAMLKSVSHNPSSVAQLKGKVNEPTLTKRPTVWGRTSARKNLSMESIELSSEDESAIQTLENAKSDLEAKIAKEVKGNAVLQASLEKRKEDLHERRLALEQDVERLRQQLQKERDLKASLESGLANMQPGSNSYTFATDSKVRADLEEVALAEADINTLNEKVADLRGQLNDEIQKSHAYLCQSCGRRLHDRGQPTKNHQLEVVERICDLDQNDESSKEASQTEDGNFENQIQDSAQSGMQIPQKPKTNTTNEASIKSKGGPMMAGRRTPSRKFSTRLENVKKESQDQSSLPNRQISERKITLINSKDSASSSDNPKMASSDGDLKRLSSRAEEGVSSSSALLKLTSRLNFLKERRAQLVNDIKNSEINRTLGLESPLVTNPK